MDEIIPRGRRHEKYANGRLTANNLTLDSEIALLKVFHYTKPGGYTVAPGFILGCGATKGSGGAASLGNAHGCADLLAGAAIWTVADRAAGRYTAFSPYVSLPTGDYDRTHALNMGENRWKIGVNAGHVAPLGGGFALDLVGDVVRHGDNTDYGSTGKTLEQAVIYNVQFHLRYRLDAKRRVQASCLHDWGGETTVNGVRQNDRKNQGRWRVGGAWSLDRANQFQLEFGADTSVENGYREKSKVVLRYSRQF